MALSVTRTTSPDVRARTSTTPAPAAPTYEVRPGDTFNAIADEAGLSPNRLAKLNPQVADRNVIDVGEVLRLRAKAAKARPTYTVKSGDTMSGIATKHDLTLAQLEKYNPQVKDPNVIEVGQKLFLAPKSRPAPTPNPTTPEPTPTPTPTPGPITNAGIPNTSGLSTAKRFALYEQYLTKFGDAQAKKDLASGKRVILALRQDTPMTADRAYRGTYDDRIVVMWKDRSGPHVQELLANTEPNRRWSIPANESSKPVGRLADNQTIRYHKAWSSKFGNHLEPYGNPWAQRDADRDYRFEKNEKAYNGEWGGQAMFIHRAWSTDTGSQGCQTMEEGRFNTFWNALGGQNDFSYVLVNVSKR